VDATRGGQVWVLGGGGRVGGAVVGRLAGRGVRVTAVGRGGQLPRGRPGVLVNAAGPDAGAAVARAWVTRGGHYVDLGADLRSMRPVLALHGIAVQAGSTVVAGAGFGVLACEAVVARLCAGRPVPAWVRVDALASVATVAGPVGEAYAASVVDVLAGGGWRYEGGRPVRARLGAGALDLRLPDGETARPAGVPTGELLAARRISGAPDVRVTNALAPPAPLARAALPLVGAALAVPCVRRPAIRALAGVRRKAAPRPRTHSWGHAMAGWADGTVREGWLRAGDATQFAAETAAEIAARLARGEGRPGAYTPAELFGAELAEAAGGTFVLGGDVRG
jgi:short subunit dehydrogenase-like uncharacterized protein